LCPLHPSRKTHPIEVIVVEELDPSPSHLASARDANTSSFSRDANEGMTTRKVRDLLLLMLEDYRLKPLWWL